MFGECGDAFVVGDWYEHMRTVAHIVAGAFIEIQSSS